MSGTDEVRQRIRDKVAASQDRLQREAGAHLPVPAPTRFPDAYPPEDYGTLVKEYPWLAIAAGLGGGLLLGALLPKGFGGKIGRRAVAAAAVAGELGLALSKQAGEKVAQAGSEGLARAGESAGRVRGHVARAADPARSRVRSAGLIIAREAINLAAKARK